MATKSAEFDLVVIGSGAAGMTAALVAAIQGLDVVLLERSSVLGGTTAISAGSAWVPNSHYDRTGRDNLETTKRYLDATVGSHTPEHLKQAFLTHAPRMARLLADRSDVRFQTYPHLPDYYSDRDGATTSGRVLETLPFDGRLLGKDFRLLKSPLPEFTIFGGMMVSRSDITQLLGALHSLPSFIATLRMLARHAMDRLSFPRGTRLVMGNALVARLLYSLRQRNVTIETGSKVQNLIVEHGAVRGVVLAASDGERIVGARRGVVLATGGFTHHPELRQKLLAKPVATYSVVPEENAGGGVALGLQAGGQLGSGHANSAFWAPASIRKRQNGTTAVFPHFALDRGKPGLIAVNSEGQRFVNEATSYQMFVEAIYASHSRTPTIPCFFICDAVFLRTYGLGMIRPGTLNPQRYVDEGYLVAAGTIAELAARIGIDSDKLNQTVQRYNGFADKGKDPDFQKGATAYSRNLGDPSVTPNPNIGPLLVAPFYAIKIYPADIGTSIGLVTNGDAQVLDAAGSPIDGLYAVGNDMNSVMGGVYAGPGCTIGTGMTFGYAAAMHAAGAKTNF